jgi:chaperone required for assembly of F1-ATPase
VTGLAVLEGQISAEAAARVAHLDETWQAARWGEDSEATAHRRARSEDIKAAGRFLDLLKGEGKTRKRRKKK